MKLCRFLFTAFVLMAPGLVQADVFYDNDPSFYQYSSTTASPDTSPTVATTPSTAADSSPVATTTDSTSSTAATTPAATASAAATPAASPAPDDPPTLKEFLDYLFSLLIATLEKA